MRYTEELEEEIAELKRQNARLAATVLMVTYDAHPVYSNTTGPHGGIGGQSMTGWCNVIHGYDKKDWVWELGLHTAEAREVFQAGEFDYQKVREELWREWQEQNQ